MRVGRGAHDDRIDVVPGDRGARVAHRLAAELAGERVGGILHRIGDGDEPAARIERNVSRMYLADAPGSENGNADQGGSPSVMKCHGCFGLSLWPNYATFVPVL